MMAVERSHRGADSYWGTDFMRGDIFTKFFTDLVKDKFVEVSALVGLYAPDAWRKHVESSQEAVWTP